MECSEAEELFSEYLLGSLDQRKTQLLEAHLDSCEACNLKLKEDGETVTRLAFAAPQLEVPPRVGERLFSRIDADLSPDQAGWRRVRLGGAWRALAGAVQPNPIKALAAVLVVGMVVSGVWFNARLNDVSDNSEALGEKVAAVSSQNEGLSDELQAAARREKEVMTAVTAQRTLMYDALRFSASPGTSINLLWGTERWSSARGMLMVSRTGTEALLLVINLPPLPGDRVYQVWLVKGGQKYGAATFMVDSTGYGQAVIIPLGSIAEFDAVRITVEPFGGSSGPTGTSILDGDL